MFCFLESASGMKKVAQSGMQYLKVGIDAQMVGRGEAGISLTNGIQAVFWNPAGLAEIKGRSVFFSHNSWIADIAMDAVAYGMDLGNWGAVALSAEWVDYGELLGTSVGHTIEESSEQGYVDEGTFQLSIWPLAWHMPVKFPASLVSAGKSVISMNIMDPT
jgi:hypothetical protein